jgi:hypothetical protein
MTASSPRADEPAVHLLAALTVAAYAWILHRLVGAMLTFSFIVIATGLTNMAIAAAGGGPRLIQISRWGWLVTVLAILVIVGRPAAERDCRVNTSSFWSLPQLAFCTDHKEAIRKSLHAHPTAVLRLPGEVHR